MRTLFVIGLSLVLPHIAVGEEKKTVDDFESDRFVPKDPQVLYGVWKFKDVRKVPQREVGEPMKFELGVPRLGWPAQMELKKNMMAVMTYEEEGKKRTREFRVILGGCELFLIPIHKEGANPEEFKRAQDFRASYATPSAECMYIWKIEKGVLRMWNAADAYPTWVYAINQPAETYWFERVEAKK